MSEVHVLYYNTALAESHFGSTDYSFFLNQPIETPIDENFCIGLKSITMCKLEERFILTAPIKISQERLTPRTLLPDEVIPPKTEISFTTPHQLLEKLLAYFSRPDLCKISMAEGGFFQLEVLEGFLLHLSKEICGVAGFSCSSDTRIFQQKTKAEFFPSPTSLSLLYRN